MYRKRSTLLVWVVVCVGPFLPGCLSDSPPVVEDYTPPTIMSTDPVDEATDVPVDVKPQVFLSEEIDPASVDSSSLYLDDLAGHSALTARVTGLDHDTCELEMDWALEYNTEYSVTVTTAITDLAGNHLAADHAWTFRTVSAPVTPEMEWKSPIEFIQTSGWGMYPALSMDDAGNAMVVWLEDGFDGKFHYWARAYTLAAGWQPAERIVEDAGAGGPPAVFLGANGRAWAAGAHYDPANGHRVWVLERGPGGDWQSSPYFLGSGSSERVGNVGVCADSAGGFATLVWDEMRDSPALRNVYACQHDGSAWGSPKPLDDDYDGIHIRPRLDMSDNGYGAIVWERHTDEPVKYHMALNFDRDAVWGGARLTKIGPSASQGEIAVNDDHWSIEVCQGYEPGGFGIHAHMSFPEGSDQNRLEDAEGESHKPHISMNNGGMAVAAWEQHEDGGNYSIMVNRYTPIGGWAGSTTVAPASLRTKENPFVAVGPTGHTIVIWHDFDAYVSHRDFATGLWSEPRAISSFLTVEETAWPRVAVDRPGRAIAVWQQAELGGDDWSIRAARYEEK